MNLYGYQSLIQTEYGESVSSAKGVIAGFDSRSQIIAKKKSLPMAGLTNWAKMGDPASERGMTTTLGFHFFSTYTTNKANIATYFSLANF